MNQHNYLNYAVYQGADGEEFIARAMKGCFASTAFIEGDKEYADVLGTKFKALFGDDGMVSDAQKSHIRRLTSDEEFERLYAESHEGFKFMDAVISRVEEIKPTLTTEQLLHTQVNMTKLGVYSRLHSEYPEYTIEDFVSDIINS